jgi:hypothetical protein
MLHKEEPRPSRKHPNQIHWANIREKALIRDNRSCRCCLSKENLEIHHVTYENFGEENLQDVITLCRPCHQAITVSVRNRRKNQKSTIHEEVVANGGTLEALTDVMQRLQNDIDKVNRFIDVINKKEERDIKELGDKLSYQIYKIVKNCRGNCTKKVILQSLEGDFVNSQVQRRLKKMVKMGKLSTRPLIKHKKGRPYLVYFIQ